MVEGPPGTGKTTFIAELIALYLHVFPTARVLLSSQTHTALDHVLIKLIEKNLSHDIVRIHGERIEKIDTLARPLILDLKTRSWIERVEERARKYVKDRAEQLGLDTTEVEVVVLGEQRHILLEELRAYERDLAAVLSDTPASSLGEGEVSDEEAVNKTSTLIDEREHLDDQIKAIKRRLAKVEGKLRALGDFGEAIASSSDEMSREWMDALSKSHVHGAEFLKSQVGLQLEWFARLGVSRDFHGAVLGEARVVAGTCVGLASVPAFSELEFDLCIVDEVSKATPTETLIPMSRSKRWVLVGDPQQLPPYSELDRKKVLDQRYSIEQAEATLLDILTPRLPEACKAQLTEQRRMVTGIGNLVSDVFYDSKLVTIRKAEDRDPVTAKLHPLRLLLLEQVLRKGIKVRILISDRPTEDEFAVNDGPGPILRTLNDMMTVHANLDVSFLRDTDRVVFEVRMDDTLVGVSNEPPLGARSREPLARVFSGYQLSGTKPVRAYVESHMSAQHLAVVGKIKLPAPVRRASGKAK